VNSPATSLPSKQELLDFQARWLRPAGICAVVGALIFAASLPLQPSGTGDDDAERLTKFHDQSTELIVGQGILVGIALLLFIPLLYVLIRSVVGRTERVRRGMVVLAFIGPILFSVSGLLVSLGLSDVADKFVEQAPASTAREDLADDVIDDSGLLQAGSLLRFIGLISLVFAMIYIPLWCMRVGLLTRFWAMLGLAFGLALLLIPVGIFGLVLWFAAVGLMLAGWWPRPLPPAWEAGEAIPWPGRDDIGPAPGGDGETVEGSGREVSEQALPESAGEQDAQRPPGETQGQRRKKRKRRT